MPIQDERRPGLHKLRYPTEHAMLPLWIQCRSESSKASQVSLVRSVAAGRQGSPFTDSEDEVFGLHPVFDIETTALKSKHGQESLAFSCRIEKSAANRNASQNCPTYSSYICFGRVALAYPAGFGSAVNAFVQGSIQEGATIFLLSAKTELE